MVGHDTDALGLTGGTMIKGCSDDSPVRMTITLFSSRVGVAM
jgi:hypothetical protein